MAARVKARITPEVLLWARESSGFTLEQAAKSASVKPEKVASWERGEDQPTIRQLRLLANKYKRPIAVFYLPAPPKDFQALRDFRRLPGQVATPESPALRLEVRRAQFRRDVAIDLFRELSEEPPAFDMVGDLGDEPEVLAETIRAALGMTLGEQATWRQPYAILNGWRNRLEQAGVLVFQFSGVELEEARGFSIADQPLPVVAVNIKDSPRGRVFSMLHELAHVALRRGGLCDFSTDAALPPEPRSIEVFCNHVAGAVIAPASELLAEPLVAGRPRSQLWEDEDIQHLSRRFGASREAILRRLVIVGLASQEEYEAKRHRYLAEYRKRQEEASGFAPPDRKALSRVGTLFAQLVLSGYDQEKITASRVSDYLEVKLKHLTAIREDLSGAATVGVG